LREPHAGRTPRLSSTYINIPKDICRLLFMQLICPALALAFDNTGKRMAAKMAMIAMTTSNSIKVNPQRDELSVRLVRLCELCFFISPVVINQLSRKRLPGHPKTLGLAAISHVHFFQTSKLLSANMPLKSRRPSRDFSTGRQPYDTDTIR